jgi:AraC-like DNA-binding protein
VTVGFRFGGINLAAWQEMLGPSPVFAFKTPADLLVVQRAQRELRRLVTRRPAGYEWRGHELIQQVLGCLLAERDLLAAPVPTPAPVRRVLDAVLAEPTRDWRVRELAAIAGASYSALRALFKATQHESIHEFLQRSRLDQARMLLGDPRLAIKDVAQRLNFSSEFYFSHFFREASGMSPSQFRRQLGE